VAYLDSTISLLSAVPSFMAFFGGGPAPRRGVGTFDGTRPYYTTYECADGKLLSIGSTEPRSAAITAEVETVAGEAVMLPSSPPRRR
jgi:crotonobetainyl-CoA:carnitine CoA-transferase CaiB-like acyl-CoA transferase